jgi:hypothetical protein
MAESKPEPAANDMLRIEVVYALPERQKVISLRLPAGSTVQQAVEQSGLLVTHPEVNLAQNKLGIYAKLVKPDATLRDRDRVEIYRPLIADPKEVRRKRAAEDKAMRKGGGDKAS